MSQVYDVPIPVYVDDRLVFPEKLCFVRNERGRQYVVLADKNKVGYGFLEYDYFSGEPIQYTSRSGEVWFDKHRRKDGKLLISGDSIISVDQHIIDDMFED